MLALKVQCRCDSESYREGDAKYRGRKKTSRVGFLQIPQPCGPKSEEIASLCVVALWDVSMSVVPRDTGH